MRTGRPPDADTVYKMGVHLNGGRRYASTQPYSVGEDGRKHYVRKHWGTLDDKLKFHPNVAFLFTPARERRKFIFPKEWDLSSLDELTTNWKGGGASPKRRGRPLKQKPTEDTENEG